MFADDTTVLINHKNVSILFQEMQLEMCTIDRWLVANKLSININKTKFYVVQDSKLKCWRKILFTNKKKTY